MFVMVKNKGANMEELLGFLSIWWSHLVDIVDFVMMFIGTAMVYIAFFFFCVFLFLELFGNLFDK